MVITLVAEIFLFLRSPSMKRRMWEESGSFLILLSSSPCCPPNDAGATNLNTTDCIEGLKSETLSMVEENIDFQGIIQTKYCHLALVVIFGVCAAGMRNKAVGGAAIRNRDGISGHGQVARGSSAPLIRESNELDTPIDGSSMIMWRWCSGGRIKVSGTESTGSSSLSAKSANVPSSRMSPASGLEGLTTIGFRSCQDA